MVNLQLVKLCLALLGELLDSDPNILQTLPDTILDFIQRDSSAAAHETLRSPAHRRGMTRPTTWKSHMTRSQLTTSMNTHLAASGRLSIVNRIAPLLLRLALGVTLLSAVADRFGIWGPPGAATVTWGDWTHFVAYTAKVNSFLPGVFAPVLAIAATAAEALLGITLILGILRRPVAFASAALFALFAGAMTLSFGIKAPLDFSVFVDFAAALLLGAWPASPKLKRNDAQQ